MIFFGLKNRVLSGQIFEGVRCPNCENNKFTTFGAIKYFHLYWIPTLPMSKTVGMECTQCRQTFINKNIPADLLKKIKASIFTKKTVLPMFSGSLIVGGLIAVLFYSIHLSKIKEAGYLENPVVNDVYTIDLRKIDDKSSSEYNYGAMRVKGVTSEQVELQLSKLAYNKASGISRDFSDKKTDSDDYYDAKLVYVDHAKLKEMKASGAIYAVDRR